jgi:hypothetical protein
VTAPHEGKPPTLRRILERYVEYVAASYRVYAEWSAHLMHLVADDARAWDIAAIDLLVAAFDAEYQDHPRKRLACELLYVAGTSYVRRAATVTPDGLSDGTVLCEVAAMVDGYIESFAVPR